MSEIMLVRQKLTRLLKAVEQEISLEIQAKAYANVIRCLSDIPVLYNDNKILCVTGLLIDDHFKDFHETRFIYVNIAIDLMKRDHEFLPKLAQEWNLYEITS